MKLSLKIFSKIAPLSFIALSLLCDHAYAFKIISFNGHPARWHNSSPISIEMDPNFGSGFDSNGCDPHPPCITPKKAIQNSVNTWKNVANVSIETSNIVLKRITGTPNYDGKNQIKFFTSEWKNLPFAPPTSALAVTISTYGDTGEIEDSDIFINGEYFDWGVVNTSDENNIHDLQNVITHEVGHFFGLDHSSSNLDESNVDLLSATMFYASYLGETSRQSLEKDDIEGIQHLYTTDDVEQPSVSNINPNNVQVSYKGPVTLEITGDNFTPLTTVVLARNSNAGDIVGRILSVEGDKITASFDVSDMQTGDYSVVVANTFDKFTQIDKGFAIQNSTVAGTYNSDSNSNSDGGVAGGCRSNGSSSILFFLLPILFLIPQRFRRQGL